MFPNQEDKSKSSIAKHLNALTADKRHDSVDESEYVTEVTGISCDVIEHI